MFDTLGLICMIWSCMMLFHPLQADIQCMGSEAQESAIMNVKINLIKKELSWESSKNYSMYKCTMASQGEIIPKKVNSSLCAFPGQHMHEGASFIIEVPNANISKNCTFIPGGNVYGLDNFFSICNLLTVNIARENNSLHGMNGSAIENFSCVIYNVALMNCTWQAGRNAPADTQYFLYWKNFRDDDEVECELYIKDENGRNTGCRFKNVRIGDEEAYFLVNGSSKGSVIQFYDENIQLYKIEILTPPLNVTVNCSRGPACCIITWQPPLTSHVKNENCFLYEIIIKNKDEPKEKDQRVEVRHHSYAFQTYKEEKEYLLKIRARGKNCLINESWGEWSKTIKFGGGKDYSIFVILFLIALGTISVTLLSFCFFKRYCSSKSIFAPIPQPRDKFNASTDEDTQIKYVSLQKSCIEEITVVEEMT